jgi:hypothetical protein
LLTEREFSLTVKLDPRQFEESSSREPRAPASFFAFAGLMRVHLQNGAKQERLLQSLAPGSAAVDQHVNGLGNGVELGALRIAFVDRCRRNR